VIVNATAEAQVKFALINQKMKLLANRFLMQLGPDAWTRTLELAQRWIPQPRALHPLS
jgi:hypothetical protein